MASDFLAIGARPQLAQLKRRNVVQKLDSQLLQVQNPQMDLPVHVYRLATAHSVEGRMLKRAFSKLKLEHVVIGEGHLQQERNKNSDGLEEEDLLALLWDDDTDEEDRLIQTEISDEDLERVIDRRDLIIDPPPEDSEKFDYPSKALVGR